MDLLIEFLMNNYIWVIVVVLIIIFALIGYLVDVNNPKVKKSKEVKPIVKVENEEKFEVHPSMEAYTNEDFDDPLIK